MLWIRSSHFPITALEAVHNDRRAGSKRGREVSRQARTFSVHLYAVQRLILLYQGGSGVVLPPAPNARALFLLLTLFLPPSLGGPSWRTAVPGACPPREHPPPKTSSRAEPSQQSPIRAVGAALYFHPIPSSGSNVPSSGSNVPMQISGSNIPRRARPALDHRISSLVPSPLASYSAGVPRA